MHTKRPEDDQGPHAGPAGSESDLARFRGGDLTDAEINERRNREGKPPYDPEAPENQLRTAPWPAEPRKPTLNGLASEIIAALQFKGSIHSFDAQGRPVVFNPRDLDSVARLRLTGAIHRFASDIHRLSEPDDEGARLLRDACPNCISKEDAETLEKFHPELIAGIAAEQLEQTRESIKVAEAGSIVTNEEAEYVQDLHRYERDLEAKIAGLTDARPWKHGKPSDLPPRGVLAKKLALVAGASTIGATRILSARENPRARGSLIVIAARAAELEAPNHDKVRDVGTRLWPERKGEAVARGPRRADTFALAFLAAWYQVEPRSIRRRLGTH
jgi:hypothetical protein